MTKQMKYKNLNYKLELWDTAGQEKYRSLVKGYLKGADVCIFVYDVTSNFDSNTGIDSYEALVEWIHIFDSVSSYDALKIVARNKSDLQE
jgi:Ras-related protein Rab-4B